MYEIYPFGCLQYTKYSKYFPCIQALNRISASMRMQKTKLASTGTNVLCSYYSLKIPSELCEEIDTCLNFRIFPKFCTHF